MQQRLHIQPVWIHARKPAPQRVRSRIVYAVLALAVVAAGLLWRSGLIPCRRGCRTMAATRGGR